MWDPFADPADSASAEHRKEEMRADPPQGSACLPLDPWVDPGLEALTCSMADVLRAEGLAHEQGAEQLGVGLGCTPGAESKPLTTYARAASFDEVELFADVRFRGEFKELVKQARGLSEECFSTPFRLQGLDDERHLALLVDTVVLVTCGFCLYSTCGAGAAFCIEELAVEEAVRGTGLGRRLLSWALAAAVTLRCCCVQLVCAPCVASFFEAAGFYVSHEAPRGGRTEDLLLHMKLDLGPSHCGLQHLHDAVRLSKDLPQLAGDPAVVLVCFLASHVSSEERAERFAEALATITRQEPHGPPELFVSWSAATPQLRDRTRAVLAECGVGRLHVLEQEGQQSQFQHLAACFRAVGHRLRDGGWVFFADDDDLWHPRRYFEYLSVIEALHGDTDVWTVASTTHAALRRQVLPRPVHPKDVDTLLAQGPHTCHLSDALKLIEEGAQDAVARHRHGLPEYFDMAVRAEQLRNFFLRTPQPILANTFCDRRFVNQFLERSGVRWFRPKGWLYFYSRAAGVTWVQAGDYEGGASFGVEVSAQDEKAVSELERCRPSPAMGPENTHPLCQLQQAEVAFLAAALRACIQELLISLGSLERGAVAAEDLEFVCESALKERSSICHYAGATDHLWTWARALTSTLAAQVCRSLGVRVRAAAADTE